MPMSTVGNIISSAASKKVANLLGGNTISSSAAKLFSKGLVKNLTKINSAGNEYIQFPRNLLGRSDITQYTYLYCKHETILDSEGNQQKTNLGAIYLPLPLELNVDYKSNWSSADSGISGTSGIQTAIKSAYQTGRLNAEEAKRILMEAGMPAAQDTAWYAGAKMSFEAAEGVGRAGVENAIQRVLNPMKLLNWNAPDFRSFTFTYELTPANGEEAESLNEIIYWLKRFIHTPSAPGSATLLYPPLWDIHFIDATAGDGKSPNKFLFKTEECAITGVSVDYLAKGRVFHRTGEDGKGYHAPNGVKISIAFTETKILTQNDFGNTYSSNSVTP